MDVKKLKEKTFAFATVNGFFAERLASKIVDMKVAELILNSAAERIETMSADEQTRHNASMDSSMAALEDFIITVFKHIHDTRNQYDE